MDHYFRQMQKCMFWHQNVVKHVLKSKLGIFAAKNVKRTIDKVEGVRLFRQQQCYANYFSQKLSFPTTSCHLASILSMYWRELQICTILMATSCNQLMINKRIKILLPSFLLPPLAELTGEPLWESFQPTRRQNLSNIFFSYPPNPWLLFAGIMVFFTLSKWPQPPEKVPIGKPAKFWFQKTPEIVDSWFHWKSFDKYSMLHHQ